VRSDGDFLLFERNRYSRKGFLCKYFPESAIIVDGVQPTLAELEKFEEQPESTSIIEDKISHFFSTGDNVEVIDGELINMCGKILAVNGQKITVMPKHDVLKEPLLFDASDLRKHFRLGDHVRVLAGRHEGDTGLIIRVEDDRVVVISDIGLDELELLPGHLQLYEGTSNGVDSFGKFEWGDIVHLE